MTNLTDEVTHELLLNTSTELATNFPTVSCFHACTQVSSVSPMIEARAEQCAVVIKPVCVRLIECRSQAAVGPGTIAGRDHREGAAGHHDPLDIVLLPTNI